MMSTQTKVVIYLPEEVADRWEALAEEAGQLPSDWLIDRINGQEQEQESIQQRVDEMYATTRQHVAKIEQRVKVLEETVKSQEVKESRDTVGCDARCVTVLPEDFEIVTHGTIQAGDLIGFLSNGPDGLWVPARSLIGTAVPPAYSKIFQVARKRQ
jgi:hypothetical protein